MLQAPFPDFQTTLIDTPGGRAAPFATVAKMRELVRTARIESRILNLASSLIMMEVQQDQYGEALALFKYVRGSIRYMRDIAGLETLAHPLMTINRRVGDCDDQATLLATLFEAAGYPTRFVMAGYSVADFEHVYLQVFINGEWVSADPTVYEEFGFEPPDAKIKWIERV